MAHVTCLAAARQGVYDRAGWDIRELGLAGAPPLRVVLGESRHVTVTRALRLLGIGRAQEVVLSTNAEGRMDVSELREALATAGRRSSALRQGTSTPVRSTTSRPSRTLAARCGRMGPRRRGVRPLGRREPAAGAPRRGTRARRLVGDRRAQVAQRPLRLRDRDLRAPVGARSGDGVRRALPRRLRSGSRAGPDGLQPGVLAGARARPRSGPRSGSSAARAWPTSSSVAARTRRAIAVGLAELDGCEVLNEVVLNQVLVRFEDDETDAGDPRRRAGRKARHG